MVSLKTKIALANNESQAEEAFIKDLIKREGWNYVAKHFKKKLKMYHIEQPMTRKKLEHN